MSSSPDQNSKPYNVSGDLLLSILNARNGVARTNRFNVIFTVPSKIRNLVKSQEEISIACETCSLPMRGIHAVDYAPFRQPYKIPTGYSNEDVAFTFLITGDMYLRTLFDAWTDLIVDHESYRMLYREDYTADITIEQLDSNNLVVYAVKLFNAWPAAVSPLMLDSTSTDQHHKMSVSITYEDYDILTTK